MKKVIIPFLFSLIFTCQAFSQTADEILTEYFKAMGQDKVLETNTFITKGKIMQGQFEIPFTSSSKRPMKFRSDAAFQGMEIISAFDGKTGWSVNPFSGATDPQPMTAEQADQMSMQADYDGIFYNYKEKGCTIEYIGTENIDDIKAYVLKLTRPNGDIITAYIDSENYILLKTKSNMRVQGVDTEAETIFSNYKYVDGILSAFSVETKVNGQTAMQMAFDEIKYNVDLPDSIFEMPAATVLPDSSDIK